MKNLSLLFLMLICSAGVGYSQSGQIPLIGAKAPVFTAETTNGTLNFPDDYGKNWKVLMSHPKDFTPVCTSELLELAYMQQAFEDLGVKLAVISVDNLNQHAMWKAHLEELDYKGRGAQKIHFPLIDDHSMQVSRKYGMLHSPTSTSRDIRGVYIISPDNIIRSINFYPTEVGRNMKEIERTVIALQTARDETVYTPANWNKGEDLIVPHLPYRHADRSNVQLTDLQESDKYYSVGNRLWFKRAE
ncbi:peroxiredoxin [Gaoshiqia sp. Z1-71]|uniref:peroxiredoxin n=1 Tax=Gaoshiqia hydrogeniformans TaxID=3290090 RepID=UPI003BF8AD38